MMQILGLYRPLSLTEQTLARTCQLNSGNLVNRWVVARVVGSLGVAVASLIDAIREAMLGSYAKAAQHVAIVIPVLGLGAISPTWLLIPAMKNIGYTVATESSVYAKRIALVSAALAVVGLAATYLAFAREPTPRQPSLLADVSFVAIDTFTSWLGVDLIYRCGQRLMRRRPSPPAENDNTFRITWLVTAAICTGLVPIAHAAICSVGTVKMLVTWYDAIRELCRRPPAQPPAL